MKKDIDRELRFLKQRVEAETDTKIVFRMARWSDTKLKGKITQKKTTFSWNITI